MNVIKRFSDYMALIGAEVVAPDWNPLEWKVETKYGPLRISLHATDFTKQCKPRSKYDNLVSIYCAFQNKQCEPFLQKEYNQRRVRLGMTAVVDAAGRIVGIFTDGDLRRALDKVADFSGARIAEVMTPGPRTIRPEALAVEAVQLMERHKINQLVVVDHDDKLVGALNMHDLFRAKVI